MIKKEQNLVIILVRPKGASNVGSIARAMTHFGITELRIVSPMCDVKDIKAHSMAMAGQDILKNASHYPTLKDAIMDCNLTIATSRRVGRNRSPSLSLRDDSQKIYEFIHLKKVAIVFGQEDKGLFKEEMELCQEHLVIPARPQSESYNLSQAVLLILWEIFMSNPSDFEKPENPENQKEIETIASRKEIEDLLEQILKVSIKIGFVPYYEPKRVTNTFRKMINRVEPTTREVRTMRGMIKQVNSKFSDKETE
ncbi:MAG: RNA methyltransferase [bacterium]